MLGTVVEGLGRGLRFLDGTACGSPPSLAEIKRVRDELDAVFPDSTQPHGHWAALGIM